jgi:hypothetical protein
MKTPRKILACLAAFLVAQVFAAAAQEPSIRHEFLSMPDTQTFWRVAGGIIDVTFPVYKLRVMCSRLLYFGNFCVVGVREEKEGKVVFEAYYRLTGFDFMTMDPILKEDQQSFRVVLPDGFALMEIKKSNQPSAPLAAATQGWHRQP